MKHIHREKITYPALKSIYIRRVASLKMDMDLHTHSDYELVYIMKGSGLRYIGESLHRFTDGDMTFIGPNLAHVWISGNKGNTGIADVIVLQFSRKSIESLLGMPECQQISELLDKSSGGLNLVGEARLKIKKYLDIMLKSPGIKQYSILLDILNDMSKAKHVSLLNPVSNVDENVEKKSRIERVCHFTETCYNHKLVQNNAAAIAHLTPSAFCRYFRKKTGKTYGTFLMETRIRLACKKLLQESNSISQVAYESGYNNLSNFYRQFKRITGQTPRQFQTNRLILKP